MKNSKGEYDENSEYVNKKSKNSEVNNLRFTAIMFLVLGLILPFIAYSTWKDLNDYEHGGYIKINEVLWMFYQMGGPTYGKWIAVVALLAGDVMCWLQANKHWSLYKLEKKETK